MFNWVRAHEGAAFRRGIVLCLVLVLALCGLSWYTRTHFSAMDTRFTLTRLNKTEAVATDRAGNEAVLTGSRELGLDGGPQILTYRGERIEHFISNANAQRSCLFPDGTVLADRELSDPDAPHSAEYRLVDHMVRLYENRTPLARLLVALPVSLIVVVLGLLALCFPERNWELTHFLEVEGGEPTAFALYGIQLTGVLLIAAGLIAAWFI